MKVTELFYSIQGEGINSGVPSIFIRLTGCNMIPICEWCDTKYAMEEGKEMSTMEIIKTIQGYNCNHIVLTGGEPSLQLSEIERFLCMKDISMKVEIETNGTLKVPEVWFNTITVSPKKQKIDERLLRDYNNYKNTYFKFVISNKIDFSFWDDLIHELNLKPEKIIMMPEGIEDAKIKETAKWLVEKCKDNNYRFSPRLQVWLYGNKRGV
jgi:7-carboxy-7-deazaguanine synthase